MSRGELLRAYLEERGARLRPSAGWQSISCINTAAHKRGDRLPSASVNLTKGYYRCFACDLRGDVYALYMYEHGVSFPIAQATLGGVRTTEEPTWI